MNLRLYSYIAAALLLIGAGWYLVHLKGKADKEEAAETALAAEKARSAAIAAETAQRIQNAENRSQALAQTLAGKQSEIDALRATIPKQVIRYVRPTGEPAQPAPDCPQPRLDPDFIRVWNSAADASSVHPAH